jgi:hypothetical protein
MSRTLNEIQEILCVIKASRLQAMALSCSKRTEYAQNLTSNFKVAVWRLMHICVNLTLEQVLTL